MKAIICKNFSTVDDLSWESVLDPVAGENEVVVDVKAAGLNYPDNLIVQGLYQFRPELPFSPGHEGAGLISSIGKNVSSFKVGDRVSFFKGFGAFAEKTLVAALRVHYLLIAQHSDLLENIGFEEVSSSYDQIGFLLS